MIPDAKEVQAVAQAIADAHAKESGGDWYGRHQEAISAIAAYDAIQKLRAAVAQAVPAELAQAPAQAGEPTREADDIDTAQAATDATPKPPRLKKGKAQAPEDPAA